MSGRTAGPAPNSRSLPLRLAVLATLLAGLWLLLANLEPPPVAPSPAQPSPQTGQANAPAGDASPTQEAKTHGAATHTPREDISTPRTTAHELHGTVRTLETKQPVTGGSIEARFIDCHELGITAQSVLDLHPDERNHEVTQLAAPLSPAGTYQLTLPPGAFLVELTVQPPEAVEDPATAIDMQFGRFCEQEWVFAEALTEPRKQLDLDVSRGESLTGVVIDAASKLPIPDSLVTCASSFDRFELCAARTDATGRFEITGLPERSEYDEETWLVRAASAVHFVREVTVPLTQPGPRDVTIELQQGIVLAGRVVGPRGNGVAEAELELSAELDAESEFGRALAYFERTRSGKDGSFRFCVPPAGNACLRATGYYELPPGSENWFPGEAQLAPVVAARSNLELHVPLQPQARFAVQAFYPDGRPVPERSMTVLVTSAGRTRMCASPFVAAVGVEHALVVFAPQLTGAELGNQPAPSVPTAFRGEGRCLATQSHGGAIEVSVPLTAWQFVVAPPLPSDGEPVSSGSMNVPGSHLSNVRDLTFVDADTGKPLAKTIVLIETQRASCSTFTSASGRMRLALPPGEFTVAITVGGYRPCIVRVLHRSSSYEEITLRMVH